QIPNEISYEGVLTKGQAVIVVDGGYNFRFELFDSLSGGNQRWAEDQAGIRTHLGAVTAYLGANVPLPGIFTQSLFLQVTVVGGGVQNTAGNSYATIGGGSGNSANGAAASIGGGDHNAATRSYTAIAGGFANSASGYAAAVGGGLDDTASGTEATVPGGTMNS